MRHVLRESSLFPADGAVRSETLGRNLWFFRWRRWRSPGVARGYGGVISQRALSSNLVAGEA